MEDLPAMFDAPRRQMVSESRVQRLVRSDPRLAGIEPPEWDIHGILV